MKKLLASVGIIAFGMGWMMPEFPVLAQNLDSKVLQGYKSQVQNSPYAAVMVDMAERHPNEILSQARNYCSYRKAGKTFNDFTMFVANSVYDVQDETMKGILMLHWITIGNVAGENYCPEYAPSKG